MMSTYGPDPADARLVAATFGASIAQVNRDHLIAEILAALADLAADILFFGGTALAFTHLPAGRLSEDIDLIALGDRRLVAEQITKQLEAALLRTRGPVRWSQPLGSVPDASPVIVEVGELRVKIQLLSAQGYPKWPTELRTLHSRYRDIVPAQMRVLTRAAFVAAKTVAWRDRRLPRDLYDLMELARIGAIDGEAAALYIQFGPTGKPPGASEFSAAPNDDTWRQQLAAQTRLGITASQALESVAAAWREAATELAAQTPGEQPRWSPAAASVWAKSPVADDGPGLSLPTHLQDAAAVAGELWDRWLPRKVRQAISLDIPGGAEAARTLLTFLAGVHDVGKASPGFAVKATFRDQTRHLLTAMEREGLICPPYHRGAYQRLPPHCRIGHHIVERWLIEYVGMTPRVAGTYAIVVGSHHGLAPTSTELRELATSEWLGDSPAWREVQDELVAQMAEQTRAVSILPSLRQHRLSAGTQALLMATVVIADWLASDDSRFPYANPQPAAVRLRHARIAQDLLGPWRAEKPPINTKTLLGQRFPRLSGLEPRPIQAAVIETVHKIDGPALLVVEAPMGGGKTEAALLAAEVLAEKSGAGGVFIALPTMATTDAMFGRVLEWARHLAAADPTTVFLAHGKSALNDDFRGLVRDARVRDIAGEEEDTSAETATVRSWLTGPRKGVLANLVVGTIDQALFAGLRTRHTALRHLALAGKVVIIDEVHAADVYMRRYLLRVLEWLGSYRTPVVLMSATLPPAIRQSLVAAYARGSGIRGVQLTDNDSYPRITVQADTTGEITVGNTDEPAVLVTCDAMDDSVESVVAEVSAAVRDGACVGVMRNTVRRAQDTYELLRKALGPNRVMLVHSRFAGIDRMDKEQRLRRLLGPGQDGLTERPGGFVVVGTQVLEQSLDIDFDLLVTDLAPIDIVLQRIGRLHRHQRVGRPATVTTPRVLITGVGRWADVPGSLDPGGVAVYGRAKLLRAAAVLQPYLVGRPLTLPTDIPRLVAAGYDEGLRAPRGWEQAWEEAAQADRADNAEREARARVFLLDGPRRMESWVGALQGRVADDETSARAQVRDSEDGIEVLLVYRRDGAVRTLPHFARDGDQELGLVEMAPPPDRLARVVLASSVSLPRNMTVGARLDDVIKALETRDVFTGWSKSRWLSGQLVLCLDEELMAVVVGYRICYDPDRGLTCEREGA